MAYRILIADDEAEIRDVLRLYLEKEGYEVIEAADGLEAVRLIRQGGMDLAILDIMMPGLDGYRVLRNIRETSNLPVIMLSAKGSDSDKILGLDLGADDYITKPFVPGGRSASGNRFLPALPGRRENRADVGGVSDHEAVYGKSRQGVYQAADF